MTKVKQLRTGDCVVGGVRIGPDGGVRSLLLGAYDGDVLRHVGVASSFARTRRAELRAELSPLATGLLGHPWEHGFGLEGGALGRLKGTAGRWTPDMPRATVDVAGRLLQVSSLDRVLWPETGTTKAELLEHYLRVARLLLPHLIGRPLTLHRFPQGVTGPHFFQTRTPPHPEWLRTVPLSFPRTGKTFETPVIDDLAGLVWAVNLTTIELHPFLATADDLTAPTALVLDLDPGPPAGLLDACRVALLLRAELDALGLASFPKTSGGKGLHVHVPVCDATYDSTKALARTWARELTRRHPELVVDRMTRSLRVGKVLVDWSQNDPGKSTVAPWSARGRSRPSVACPVAWDEVGGAREEGNEATLTFELGDVPERLERHGDPFAGLLSVGQRLNL